MLDLPRPATFEGSSLFDDSERVIFSERDDKFVIPYSVQDSEWKYYWEPDKEQLFNLKNDSGEKVNLLLDMNLVKEKFDKLYAEQNTTSDAQQTNVSQETFEQLKSLGYVE
jgi:hypothetical protein